MSRTVRLLASVGARLIDYDLSLDDGLLSPRTETLAAEKIDYACADAARRHLYVISSNGRPGVPGDRHWLQTFSLARGEGAGALEPCGPRHALDQRALHVCLDRDAARLFIAYSVPSVVESWRVGADGAVIGRDSRFACGHFAHQILLDEPRGLAIAVMRGTDASAGRAEEPGSLQLFDYRDRTLAPRAALAPGGGYGFGPRNAALHPSGRWLCVSLERQSRLCVFGIGAAGVTSEPVSAADTLAEPANLRPRQLGSTLAVHPGGRYVYVANRADHTVEFDGQPVFGGGENSFAVFGIDPESGALSLVQHVDSGGCYPRTFGIDRSGTRLVVANGKAMRMRDGDAHADTHGAVREVPANLAVFAIGEDGRLTLLRRHPLDVGEQSLFWSELVE